MIIPCYNEENAIGQIIDSLKKNLEGTGPYEIIVVNDGSTDRSTEILKGITEKDPFIKVINHRHNRGYGAALKTGIRHASGELVVTTDADGSYPNECLPELISLASEADMVVGARTAPDVQYSTIRKIPKFFLKLYCSWITKEKIPDMNSGMRVFRRSSIEKLLHFLPDGFSFTTTITIAMLTNGYNVQYIPIGYSKRIGKSKIRPFYDTLNFLLLIMRTGTYFAPMRVFLPFASILLILSAISFFYDVFILDNITDKTVILILFSMNTGFFALLADMITKRQDK